MCVLIGVPGTHASWKIHCHGWGKAKQSRGVWCEHTKTRVGPMNILRWVRTKAETAGLFESNDGNSYHWESGACSLVMVLLCEISMIFLKMVICYTLKSLLGRANAFTHGKWKKISFHPRSCMVIPLTIHTWQILLLFQAVADSSFHFPHKHCSALSLFL